MKTTSIIFAAAFAVASASTIPGKRDLSWFDPKFHYCHDIGESCFKVKRATEEATSILDELSKRTAEPSPEACSAEGSICNVARDVELALRDAIAFAGNYMDVDTAEFDKRDLSWFDPKFHYCHDIGESCFKAKRDADDSYTYCHAGGQCSKVRRAAEAIEAAAKIERRDDLSWFDPKFHYCHDIGEACFKAKRALEYLQRSAGNAVNLLTN
jgi:hypothetical protein